MVESLIKYAKGQGENGINNLQKIKAYLGEENNAFLEMQILNRLFKESVVDNTKLRVFNSEGFLNRVKELVGDSELYAKNELLKDFGVNFEGFKGKEAVLKLLEEKRGQVSGAFYKEGLGEIDIFWGDSKKGLNHILERRKEDFIKQGLDENEALNKALGFVKKIPQIIEQGKVKKGKNRAFIDTKENRALIALDYKGKDRKWVITAYKMDDPSQADTHLTRLNTSTSSVSRASVAKESITQPLFKSKEAREFLELVEGFHKLYKNDALIAKNFTQGTASQLSTSIATSAEGAIKQKVVKGGFDPIFRLLPDGILFGLFSKQIQGGALRYHLRKALSRSLNYDDFKIKLERELKRTNFNSNTSRLIEKFMQNLEDFNAEKEAKLARIREEELKRAEEELKRLNEIKAAQENAYHTQEANLGNDILTAEESPLKEDFGENFEGFKGKEAINKLLEEKRGQVKGAFYKEGLGDIDLVWGEITDFEKHKGYGLAHILDKRKSEFVEQGANESEAAQKAAEFAKNEISNIMQNGKIINKANEATRIETQDYRLILKQNWKGEPTKNKWLVTAYMKKEKGESISSAPFTKEDNLSLNSKESIAQKALNLHEKLYLKDNDTPLSVEYKIVNKNDVKPSFELSKTQYRSEKQEELIAKIKNNFNPDLLVNIRGDLKKGNPIITQNGEVISGNHRAEALKELEGENLSKYQKAVKEVFGVELKENEMLVRVVSEEVSEADIKRFSAASNEGLENNLGEQGVSLFAKYQDKIKALKEAKTPFVADDVYNLKYLVNKALGESSITKENDTSKVLFASLARGRNNTILKALNELEKENLEQVSKVANMFFDNAGAFYNLTHDLDLPKMQNLQNYFSDVLVSTAKADYTRAEDFTKLNEDIRAFLDSSDKEAMLKLSPNLVSDLLTKALGAGFARFARLENPSASLFDFLKGLKAELIEKGAPDLFSGGKGTPLNERDEFDFAKELILKGQDSEAKFKLYGNLEELKAWKSKSSLNQPTKELKHKMLERLKPLFKQEIYTKDGFKGVFNLKSLSKMTSDKAIQKSINNGFSKEEHLRAVLDIERLFKNANLAKTYNDEKGGKNVLIHRFNSEFENANALITTKESLDKDLNKIYSLELELTPRFSDEVRPTDTKSNTGDFNSQEHMADENIATIAKTDEESIAQKADDFGVNFEGFKGKEAINKLLEEKRGQVKGAFYKEGLGEIDLVWGDENFGLRHILEQRAKQWGEEKALKFISHLSENIEKGQIVELEKGRVGIKTDLTTIILDKKENNNFVLTAFRDRNNKKELESLNLSQSKTFTSENAETNAKESPVTPLNQESIIAQNSEKLPFEMQVLVEDKLSGDEVRYLANKIGEKSTMSYFKDYLLKMDRDFHTRAKDIIREYYKIEPFRKELENQWENVKEAYKNGEMSLKEFKFLSKYKDEKSFLNQVAGVLWLQNDELVKNRGYTFNKYGKIEEGKGDNYYQNLALEYDGALKNLKKWFYYIQKANKQAQSFFNKNEPQDLKPKKVLGAKMKNEKLKSDLLDKTKPLRKAEKEELTNELLEEAKEQNAKIWVGNLESENLADELGLNFQKGVKITMNGNALKHIEKRHGVNSTLAKNGQPIVENEDYANHAKIVNEADKRKIILSEDNQKILVSGKQINGYHIIIESISTKDNELKLKTMYKENGSLENSNIFKEPVRDRISGGESLRVNPSNALDPNGLNESIAQNAGEIKPLSKKDWTQFEKHIEYIKENYKDIFLQASGEYHQKKRELDIKELERDIRAYERKLKWALSDDSMKELERQIEESKKQNRLNLYALRQQEEALTYKKELPQKIKELNERLSYLQSKEGLEDAKKADKNAKLKAKEAKEQIEEFIKDRPHYEFDDENIILALKPEKLSEMDVFRAAFFQIINFNPQEIVKIIKDWGKAKIKAVNENSSYFDRLRKRVFELMENREDLHTFFKKYPNKISSQKQKQDFLKELENVLYKKEKEPYDREKELKKVIRQIYFKDIDRTNEFIVGKTQNLSEKAFLKTQDEEYIKNLKKWSEGAKHTLAEDGLPYIDKKGFYYNDKELLNSDKKEKYETALKQHKNFPEFINDLMWSKGYKYDETLREYFLKHRKSLLNEGSFKIDEANYISSNPHLGAGLLGGSLNGVEQDEEGNLSFDPAKFAMGFLGGSLGSKAVRVGFKHLEKNPALKEKIITELADTLAQGFDKAREKYPLLSTLEPRYIVQNERGRKIQAKVMLKELEREQNKNLQNIIRQNLQNLPLNNKPLELSEKQVKLLINRFANARNLKEHLNTRADNRKELYALLNDTLENPQIHFIKEGRDKYVKRYKGDVNEPYFYLLITQDKDKIFITHLKTRDIKYLSRQISNAEQIKKGADIIEALSQRAGDDKASASKKDYSK